MNQLQQSHLDFVLGLSGALEPGSVWSPYSVASALGLAAAGARGQTYEQLAAALAPGSELAEQGRMLSASAGPEGAETAVANTLWTRTGLPFEDGYRRAVLDWPGGALHSADFAGDPEGARRAINADVEKTTRGLVRELLGPGLIHPAVAAVIVNALYLKVAWRLPFPATATASAGFHAPSGTRQVPTMRQTERMPYAAAAGWRMVTLPTAGALAVDVLLPDEPGEPERPGEPEGPGDAGTPGAPALPDRATLARLRGAVAPTKVALALPRFRAERRLVLNEALGRLGVTRAFGGDADFSGITSAERVRIDQVVHKAVVDVDESGFEGAAATAVVMRTVSIDLGTPVEFRVDRPFVLVVRHAETGAVFFLAHVTEP